MINSSASINTNQNLHITGQATLENAQIGGIAGHDLTVTQIQGQVINVTVQDALDLSGMLGQVAVRDNQPRNQQDYRQRQVLLNKVKQFWIVGVLKNSVFTQVLLELELRTQHNLVDRPFQQYFETEAPLTSDSTPEITDVFNQMGEGRTLLILGEPGSGKTTTLLKLAQNLIARSEEDLNRPLPVVFNLSSWTKTRLAFADWLVEELHQSYKVSHSLAQKWVGQQQLLLLLDGLDEVEAGQRPGCVRAINQFMQTHGTTEMVICCRNQDYAELPLQLSLQGAIQIEALNFQQIQRYLAQMGQSLTGLRLLLEKNTDLRSFASSPLSLSVMCLAYRDRSPAALLQSASTSQLFPQLWRIYVERMLQRRSTPQTYLPTQTQQWLRVLATHLAQSSQTVFWIEQLQPTWLHHAGQRRIYRLGIILMGSGVFGLMGLGIGGLVGGSIGMLTSGLILAQSTPTIETVETMQWSTLSAIRRLLPSLFASLPLGLSIGFLLGITRTLESGLGGGLSLGVIYGICGSLIFGVIAGLKGPAIATKTKPNQGIFESLHIACFISTVGGIMGGILGLAISPTWLKLGLIYGMTVGFLYGGGQTCLQHFMVRILLYRRGSIPWNYARFLDEAAERILLQKVGSGYMFIHRRLRDHFAQEEVY